MARFFMKTVIAAAASFVYGCQSPKPTSATADAAVQVQLAAQNPNGIYSYDFTSGQTVQLVAVEPTNELIKYTFVRSESGVRFYYIEDQAGQRNLYTAQSIETGGVIQAPTKILGDDDLNGPAMCVSTGRLLFGQLNKDSVQIMSLTADANAAPELLYDKPNFVAADLHCREGVAGAWISGLECPSGQSLGMCFGNPENDSLSRIFRIVDGEAQPVTEPEMDPQVTALPRLRLFHRGDVDSATAKLADGGVALGFSRLFNSPALAAVDTPSYLKGIGYQKLMMKRDDAKGNLIGSGESEIDLPAFFRQQWQLSSDKVIDFVTATVDLREQASSPGTVEFVVKTLIAARGEENDRFDGLLYGRLLTSELGKPKPSLLEVRPLLTAEKLSCGIWKNAGLRDADGSVYMYGMIFPRFIDLGATTIYFSTQRNRIGKYRPENGGAIETESGNVIPARDFALAFCGFDLPRNRMD